MKNKESNFVSAVLYVRNNEEDIINSLSRIYNILESNFKKFEIICVDDASEDGSNEKIKIFSETVKNTVVSVVNMGKYQGLELSMNAGVDLSIGDFVFEFDEIVFDFSDEMVMEIYYKSLSGYDIVSAVPSNRKKSYSSFYYKIFNRYSNIKNGIKTESFRILSRRSINRVHSLTKTIPYRKVLYANSGLKSTSISYNSLLTRKHRDDRRDKMNRKLALDSIVMFTNLAYKIAVTMTLLMMFFSVCVACYAIFTYLGHNKPIEGWTTTILFLSVSFFFVFLINVFVLKYLAILMDLVFSKKKYLIESIQKLT